MTIRYTISIPTKTVTKIIACGSNLSDVRVCAGTRTVDMVNCEDCRGCKDEWESERPIIKGGSYES